MSDTRNYPVRFGFKALMTGIICLIMLIPLAMVRSQISDREESMREAVSSVISSWSDSQCLSGPRIVYMYDEVSVNAADGKVSTVNKTAAIWPESLDYDIDAVTFQLHRSIYDVTVYNSTVGVKATFDIPEEFCEAKEAYIYLELSDLRGIEGEAAVTFAGKAYKFVADEGNGTVRARIETSVPGGKADLEMDLRIKGSEMISVKPVGEITTVSMKADCPTPSFVGDFLPSERNVTEDGFTALWVVSQINRGAPESSSFGVRLLEGVTQYQLVTRSVKYGILVILLVLLAGLCVELVTHKEIALVQYLVIGLSLVLFYALLLSFSEFWNFGISYLVAAAMTVTALTAYFRAILRSKLAWLLGLLVAVAYALCFVLLQMETYAFLAGTLVLFALLCVVMYLTRNLGQKHKETQELTK